MFSRALPKLEVGNLLNNLKNICTIKSKEKNRFYLAHYNCYLSLLNTNDLNVINLNNLKGIPLMKNSKIDNFSGAIHTLKNLQELNSDGLKQYYGVKIQGFHPLSTRLLFSLDKIRPRRRNRESTYSGDSPPH